jgi:hypothetical protein
MHQPARSQLLDFVACVTFWISKLSKYMAILYVVKFFLFLAEHLFIHSVSSIRLVQNLSDIRVIKRVYWASIVALYITCLCYTETLGTYIMQEESLCNELQNSLFPGTRSRVTAQFV